MYSVSFSACIHTFIIIIFFFTLPAAELGLSVREIGLLESSQVKDRQTAVVWDLEMKAQMRGLPCLRV